MTLFRALKETTSVATAESRLGMSLSRLMVSVCWFSSPPCDWKTLQPPKEAIRSVSASKDRILSVLALRKAQSLSIQADRAGERCWPVGRRHQYPFAQVLQ